MRIDSVDAFYLRMPEVFDIGDGSQDGLLIRVRAGEHEGWGECEASPLTTIAALVAPMSHSACHPVLDSVLGQEIDAPADIERIHHLVRSRSFDLLQTDHALSGIDIALWDLLAKKRSIPVWSLLGAANEPKIAYASQLFGRTPEETFEAAKLVAGSNFRAAKFGWGPIGRGSEQDDRLQIEAAREGLGPEKLLLVDTGCVFGHDIDRALSRMATFESAGVGWWEEPFESGALAEYGQLSKRTSVPLAAGEGAHNVDQAQHLIDYGGVRFIQVDCGRIGGITAARKVAHYAQAKGVSYVNHTFTSNLALSASLQPYADFVGAFAEVPVATSALARAIGSEPLAPDGDGMISASDLPGLGVQIDLERLEQYSVEVEIRVGGAGLWPADASRFSRNA